MKFWNISQMRLKLSDNKTKFERHLKSMCFTLLELIIVITIIMILAAFLLPALKSAKEITKRIQCAGNLKQIGISLQSYVDDYSLYVPAGSSWSSWADNLLPYLILKSV